MDYIKLAVILKGTRKQLEDEFSTFIFLDTLLEINWQVKAVSKHIYQHSSKDVDALSVRCYYFFRWKSNL